MEVSADEKPQSPTNSSREEKVSSDPENPAHELSNTNGGAKSDHKFSPEEVRDVLQAIASTGKYWHEWDDLKSMLSFQLKQVLSEYPEAKVGDDPEKSCIREAFMDLFNRLNEALQSFIEGPPFTLQRICEILLDAQGIYPVLSKLELALEKNMLVTTTLPRSTDAHLKLQPSSPQLVGQPGEITKAGSDHVNSPCSDPVENGEEESSPEVRDEIMTEAVVPEVEHDTAMDTDTIEEIVSSEEKKVEPPSNASTTTAPPTSAAATIAPSTAPAPAPTAAPPVDSASIVPSTAPAPAPTPIDATPAADAAVAPTPIDATPASTDAPTDAPSTAAPTDAAPTDADAAATAAATCDAAAPPTDTAAPASVPSTIDTTATTVTSTDSKIDGANP